MSCWRETVKDEELLRIMRELGLKSYLGVPLKARGDDARGVITFVAAESGRRYDATDLAVAEDLAHRAAIAIENARLYTRSAGGRPPQGRVPGDAGPRTAQPAGPDPQRPAHPAAAGAARRRGRSEAREMMERQVRHMVRLVDDLLDVSRITRGKIELRKEVVDLAAVVDRAVETIRPLIEDRRHELTVGTCRPSRCCLEADPTRLDQVFANLLNNAAKYTEPGGRIWLTAERDGGEVVVRVRDTGIGIAADMLPRIFDLFVQVDRSLDRSQGGLGIGLTLVRSLVEMHGGTRRGPQRRAGQGQRVHRPPAALAGASDPPPRSRPTRERASRRRRPQRRILVVDDNLDAAESLAMLLRMEGHEVRVAHDGPAALEAAQADPPDLVFLDIGMPG